MISITTITRGKGMNRSGRPAPGSIPDRVLEIVGEFDGPVTMGQILAEKHGAKNGGVIEAVRGLVRAGHLIGTGGPRNRQYSLPGIKKGKTA